MIASLDESPRSWLSLKVCRDIFNRFREKIEFDQPIPPYKERYPDRLEGIIGSVKQTFGGKHLNSTVYDASVAYFVQFILGHAFKNGNRRMAVLFTHFFLLMNGFDFKLDNREIYTVALQVARLREKGYSKERIVKIVKRVFKDFIVERK